MNKKRAFANDARRLAGLRLSDHYLNFSAAIIVLLVANLFPAPAYSFQKADRKWEIARHQMVELAVVQAGVKDSRVIESMKATRRHEFVPKNMRVRAYLDAGVPIGHKQTISSPFIVAYMTQTLDPQPTDKVLEIGTGSGYQAAILSPLVKEVYSIEIVEPRLKTFRNHW